MVAVLTIIIGEHWRYTMNDNIALTPARIYVSPTEERFQDSYRRWQGIPSIEVSKKGRIFVNFYTGQGAEVGGNIMVLCVSDDNGKSFRSCATVVEHPDKSCRRQPIPRAGPASYPFRQIIA